MKLLAPRWSETVRGFLTIAASALLSCDGTAARPGSVVPVPVRDNGPIEAAPGSSMDKKSVAGLSASLEAGKLRGWIHAAVHGHGLYVFTWRAPNDFFTFYDFPVYPGNPEVAKKLGTVKRHDELSVKGHYVVNAAPIQHIIVNSFDVITAHQSDETPPPRTVATRIPAALMGKNELLGKVHALGDEGHLLVVEYGDAVVPVYVQDASLTKDLFRNDKLKIAFQIAPRPASPTHLWVDSGAKKPIDVLERMVERHGKTADVEGVLVRFPKSPQITSDVYAVQITDADGISREYTLVNEKASDTATFREILKKCADAWAARRSGSIDGRNKLLNPLVRVRAQGKWNVVSRNQANVQIVMPSADGVTITLLPTP